MGFIDRFYGFRPQMEVGRDLRRTTYAVNHDGKQMGTQLWEYAGVPRKGTGPIVLKPDELLQIGGVIFLRISNFKLNMM